MSHIALPLSGRRWLFAWPVVWVACALAAIAPQSAAAQGAPPASPEPAAVDARDGAQRSSLDGAGASLWGEIPAPADSVRARLANRPLALWEKTLIYPYTVVKLPFRVATDALKGTLVFLDESQAIAKVTRLLAPKEIAYGVLLSARAGGASGFGGGATLYHNSPFSPDNRGQLRFETTSSGIRKVSLGVMTGVGASTGWELGAGYRKRPNTRFYGIGPDSREEDESFYTQELSWAGLGLRRQLGGAGVSVLGEALFSAVDSRGPNDDHQNQAIESVFDGRLPQGHADRSDGLTLSLTLEHDSAHSTGRPESGAVHRLRAAWFESTDRDQVSFWTYRAEAQEFIPLWYSQRALALRGLVGWVDPNGGSAVPFQRLLTNDDPDLLRGYQDFRWRDRGLLIATAEYRFPWWAHADPEDAGLDFYLLGDLGQVFGETDQVALRRLQASGGFGLRLVGQRGFLTRAEVAFSDEGSVFRLRADQVFQFMKGGLFHGRDPVPSR